MPQCLIALQCLTNITIITMFNQCHNVTLTDLYCTTHAKISRCVILSGAAQRHNGEHETRQLPRSRTPKGRRQAESRHSCKALYPNASRPQIKRDSRTFCRHAPPDTPKLPCAATAARKRKKSLPSLRRLPCREVRGGSGRFGG